LVIATKIVLVMEYNGTHYHGFQLQANLPTIQRELEKAIWELTGERRRVMTASRTDSGVHAKGQVVSFRTESSLPTQTFVDGLNYYLPRDIAIKAAYKVDNSFNVRQKALSREYSYHILNSPTRSPLQEAFSYLVPGHLDTDAMNQACQTLIDEHDFASFATCLGKEKRNTKRHVYSAQVEKSEELTMFTIVANSFLPHQVRNTVGALIKVGRNKLTPDEFSHLLEAKQPGLAGPTAPACGLYLMQVNYPHSWENYNENL